jgi:hypothetical protein
MPSSRTVKSMLAFGFGLTGILVAAPGAAPASGIGTATTSTAPAPPSTKTVPKRRETPTIKLLPPITAAMTGPELAASTGEQLISPPAPPVVSAEALPRTL